jgi:Protein of unknown function (DUF2786)
VADDKTIARIQKLLALARDRGASPAEAELAMQRATDIMTSLGLEMAEIEARGGEGEPRERSQYEAGYVTKTWHVPLMTKIAEVCACHVSVSGDRVSSYQLIGRRSAVASARVMFDYLVQAVRRAVREHEKAGSPGGSARYVARGMAERLCERLRERLEQQLSEQWHAAEAERERRRQSGGVDTSVPVVVVADYYASEADLNEDARRGLTPGTTAARRRELEADQEAMNAREEQLIAEGVNPDVAWRMAQLNETREEVEAVLARRRAAAAEREEETEAQRRARERREERASRAYWRRAAREHAKRSGAAWQSGRRRADETSLDQQVGTGSDSSRLPER